MSLRNQWTLKLVAFQMPNDIHLCLKVLHSRDPSFLSQIPTFSLFPFASFYEIIRGRPVMIKMTISTVVDRPENLQGQKSWGLEGQTSERPPPAVSPSARMCLHISTSLPPWDHSAADSQRPSLSYCTNFLITPCSDFGPRQYPSFHRAAGRIL